jgi:alpha-D-ribose 1-methylphosphonate 5-triphosphate diphosphatase
MAMMTLTGGQVLRDGALLQGDLHLCDGAFTEIRGFGRNFDATGLLVLPGIVDIHGDAFERQMQPRPNVAFNPVFALAETERQLLGCGITTAYHSVTLSWEPGLRGIEAWRALLAALAQRTWTCDMRIHLRWEAFNLEALDEVLGDIHAGRVHLVAFNDHTAAILKKLSNPFEASKYVGRTGMKAETFAELARHVASRAAEVPAALDRIAALCRTKSIPMASHDDETIPMREEFAARGANICEFPVTDEVGRFARTRGDAIVMGSPNVVRGGSHLGWTSAAESAERGICSVLTSDYYYPCLLAAPFVLQARGTLDLAQAWALVSANPAAAAGLSDRGSIAAGKRADLVLVDPTTRDPVATFVAGRPAFLSAAGAARLG